MEASDPTFYQAKGQAAQTNLFLELYNLTQWGDSGNLNPQSQGASPPYANYVYGVYMRQDTRLIRLSRGQTGSRNTLEATGRAGSHLPVHARRQCHEYHLRI
jgi:hypothetical protein